MEWRHLSPVFCVWARWRNSRFRTMFFKSGVYIFSPEAGGTETKVESIATSLDHRKWASNCRSNKGVDWQARIKCERWRSMIFYDLSSRTWVVWDRTCNRVCIGRVYRGYVWHIWRKSGLEYGWWVVVRCGFPGHFFWDIICYFQISFIKCTRNTSTVSIYPPSTWHSPFAVVSLPLCPPVVAFPLAPELTPSPEVHLLSSPHFEVDLLSSSVMSLCCATPFPRHRCLDQCRWRLPRPWHPLSIPL